MRHKNLLFAAAMIIAGVSGVFANTGKGAELAKQAGSPDQKAAINAIRELRSMGRTGLDALLAEYAGEIGAFKRGSSVTPEWKRIANAIDTVAMQKDAYASGLYWYTDLETAKREAAKTDKPVLSLRLLGNLNEEFSCANSRIFRAVLYPNSEVSKFLRENYILHWRSVRPAPRITIDFGDGRKIERTVTGNSIHYIMDDEGTLIEALPGLYSPKAFLVYLKQAKLANDRVADESDEKRANALMSYRKLSFERLVQRRAAALAKSNVDVYSRTDGLRAIEVAPITAAKTVIVDEISILRVYDDLARFEPNIDFGEWMRLSKVYSPDNELDANSLEFVRRQTARTGLTAAEFDRMLAKLNEFVALDTTRNDLLLHPTLYSWLNDEPAEDIEKFNSRVYAEIFKTPDHDKWLGLYSTDVYTALDGNGIIR